MAKKPLIANAGQHARFVEAAREAGADVDTNVADRLMGKLATMPVEPRPTSTKKAKDTSK